MLSIFAVAEVCCRYTGAAAQRCVELVADRCLEAWEERDGGAAVPAAFVLNSVMSQVLLKPVSSKDACGMFHAP